MFRPNCSLIRLVKQDGRVKGVTAKTLPVNGQATGQTLIHLKADGDRYQSWGRSWDSGWGRRCLSMQFLGRSFKHQGGISHFFLQQAIYFAY